MRRYLWRRADGVAVLPDQPCGQKADQYPIPDSLSAVKNRTDPHRHLRRYDHHRRSDPEPHGHELRSGNGLKNGIICKIVLKTNRILHNPLIGQESKRKKPVKAEVKEPEDTEETNQFKEEDIQFEIKENREEHVKHFHMKYGKDVAVTYREAVFSYDGNEYTEIDNHLFKNKKGYGNEM